MTLIEFVLFNKYFGVIKRARTGGLYGGEKKYIRRVSGGNIREEIISQS